MRRSALMVAGLLLATPSIGLAERPVERCSGGDNCINGIRIVGKPTKAELAALQQAVLEYQAAVAKSPTTIRSESLSDSPAAAVFPEPLPNGDLESVKAGAEKLCQHSGHDPCMAVRMGEYRAAKGLWELGSLDPKRRETFRQVIPRHTRDGVTNWGSALAEYRFAVGDLQKLPPGYSPPAGNFNGYRFSSTCTLRTRTTGSLGNQTITSTMDCY